eukprot:4936477-Amphidinium_carterae.1
MLVEALLQELRRTGVPQASSSRKGVLGDESDQAHGPPVRSCLFGLYTKIGMGVTNHTSKDKWRRALQIIHALARRRPKGALHDYTSIMLNHNEQVAVHADRYNHGPSSLLSLGVHEGGMLWIESDDGAHTIRAEGVELRGKVLDTHGRWQCFSALDRHCVLPSTVASSQEEGSERVVERYSISLFCPGRLSEVPAHTWSQLERAGFPVSSVRPESSASESPPNSPEQPEAGVVEEGLRRRCKVSRLACLPHFHPPMVHQCLLAHLQGAQHLRQLVAQLQRQRSPSRFLEFLRQGAQFAVGGEDAPSQGDESRSILPCGLPYPPSVRSLAPASGRRRARWHRVRHRRQWINASVAYLDWLYLGKPGGTGLKWASALQTPLSVQQWALVQKLESTYLAVCRLGETPESPSGGLEQLARCLHVTMDLDYGGQTVQKSAVVPVELNGDNMSLPDQAGLVPLKSPVVPHEFEVMLEEPGVFLRAAQDMPERLRPTPLVHVRSIMAQHSQATFAQGLVPAGAALRGSTMAWSPSESRSVWSSEGRYRDAQGHHRQETPQFHRAMLATGHDGKGIARTVGA